MTNIWVLFLQTISLIASTVAAVFSAIATIRTIENRNAIENVHLTLNSRLDQLLDKTQQVAFEAGRKAAEIAEEKATEIARKVLENGNHTTTEEKVAELAREVVSGREKALEEIAKEEKKGRREEVEADRRSREGGG